MSIPAQEGATRLIDAARTRTATTALTSDCGDFDIPAA